MKLALLLPQLAPNLYDLSAMLQADRVILQDTERWSRKSRVHRALIRTDDGTQWINIPVCTKDRKKAINEVRIDHARNWINPLLRSLKYNYRNSIYFDFYEPSIERMFRSTIEYKYLQTFVFDFQQRLFNMMNLEVEYELASDVSEYTSDPEALAQNLGVDVLFQEWDSRHYQRQAQNRNEQNFHHPEYYQHFEGFEPNCCLLDVLFQLGPESFKIIDKLYGHKKC